MLFFARICVKLACSLTIWRIGWRDFFVTRQCFTYNKSHKATNLVCLYQTSHLPLLGVHIKCALSFEDSDFMLHSGALGKL